MSRIPGTTASDSIELVRKHGDMAVVAPDPTAPRPSDAAMEAAAALLAEPLRMKAEILATAEKLTQQMHQFELTLNQLTEYVLAKKKASDPSARNFFLNEAHTTHITKSQLRRERREAQAKREAESKSVRPGRKTRKSGSGRSRNR
jgi:hypothetical protein